jgi:hypothetical protein
MIVGVLTTNHTQYTSDSSIGGRGLSDRAGNSGYPRFGDTSAAILRKAGELSSSTTENMFRPVAMLLK